jgi:hypothetical protein
MNELTKKTERAKVLMFHKKTDSISNYDGGHTELGKFSVGEDNPNSKTNKTTL